MGINSIIAMQGPADRHLELCYIDETLIGFLYGEIDHEDHNGFIKPGFGYIMEFYVRLEYRRRGYGRMMFKHLEQLFYDDGANMMYLTADPVTGKPFWEELGFLNTYVEHLDNVLKATGEKMLEGAGSISHIEAMEKANKEYQKYQVQNLSPVEEEYLLTIKDIEKQAKSC